MGVEEDVQTLLDFTGYQLGKDEARQLLKVWPGLFTLSRVLTAAQISNNDLETATQKFFETDPSNLKSLLSDSVPNWDESAFGSGRYGQDDTTGANIPSTWSRAHAHNRTCREGDTG
jgi:hypothetical protein